MAEILTIYCEGKRGSHDFDILEKVTTGLSPLQIKPIGGVRGAKSIMSYLEMSESGATRSGYYCLFRDRDFDYPQPTSEELVFDGKHTYAGYRITIENYLFDVSHFYRFVSEKGMEDQYGIYSEEDAKTKFIEAAKRIKYYQATRHALGELRSTPSFKTTWTEKSGVLPDSLDCTFCRISAGRLLLQAKIQTKKWSQNILQQTIEKYLILFDDDFFDNLCFLTQFQGKDFAASLEQLLPNFPLRDYYKFAKQHFGDYSQPNSTSNKLFPDLMQLRTILKDKANIA